MNPVLRKNKTINRMYTFSGGGNSIFDQYGTPLFAYSLQDLNGTDPVVVTLRRGGDDAEQSFTASQVQAETDIISFADGGNGSARIKVFHNQVSGGDNIIQTTNAKQPELVNSGVVRKVNGKPSAFWDSGNSPNVPLPASYKNVIHNVYRVHLAGISNYCYPTDSSSSSNYGYLADNGSSLTNIKGNYGASTLYVNNELSTSVNQGEIYTEFGANSSAVQISILGENVTNWSGTVRIGSSSGVTASGVFYGFIPEYIAYASGDYKEDFALNQMLRYSIS